RRNRRRIRDRAARFRHEDPDVSVSLFAGIIGGVNLLRLDPRILGERRNLRTSAGVYVESPAVIAALEVLSLDPTAGKGNAAVRTNVLHGEGSVIGVTPENERLAQEHRLDQFSPTQLSAQRRRIPEIKQHLPSRRGIIGSAGRL